MGRGTDGLKILLPICCLSNGAVGRGWVNKYLEEIWIDHYSSSLPSTEYLVPCGEELIETVDGDVCVGDLFKYLNERSRKVV